MPQVLAKRPRPLPFFLVLMLLGLFPSPRALLWLGGWLGGPGFAAWSVDTVPVDPDEGSVDHGGASMDPAGQPRPGTGG